jgi:DNA-binding response OmpR family regulator
MPAPTIFVMDEDQDALDLVTELLTTAGYKVLVAASRSDAVTTLQAVHPNLAILDLDMDRFDWFREISERCVEEGIPLIILSSRADDPAPGHVIVEKPFAPHRLLESVQALLQEMKA